MGSDRKSDPIQSAFNKIRPPAKTRQYTILY